MKKSFDSASDLDGYDDLNDDDKAKVDLAWENGKVADEDIPESAKKADDGEEKSKKKKASTKKKVRSLVICFRDHAYVYPQTDEDGADEEKPKKKETVKKPRAKV